MRTVLLLCIAVIPGAILAGCSSWPSSTAWSVEPGKGIAAFRIGSPLTPEMLELMGPYKQRHHDYVHYEEQFLYNNDPESFTYALTFRRPLPATADNNWSLQIVSVYPAKQPLKLHTWARPNRALLPWLAHLGKPTTTTKFIGPREYGWDWAYQGIYFLVNHNTGLIERITIFPPDEAKPQP